MIGIFGASGFIGRNLIDYFNIKGLHFKVFSRHPIPGFNGKTIPFHFEDPSTYIDYLEELNSVILLVSASLPGTYEYNFPSEIERNVLPYSRFFNAIQSSSIQRVIYLSSGGTIYGTQQTPLIDEMHTTNPINAYGCGKLMIEDMIKTLSLQAPWTYTILRPSNPIGPHQTGSKNQGLVAKVVYACLFHKELEIWGDGTALRDYFDVRDLCSAIALVLYSPSAYNSVFNVGSGNAKSVQEIVQSVKKIMGANLLIKYQSSRCFDVKQNVLDITKIRSIGWQPTWEFELSVKAITETIYNFFPSLLA